MTVMQALRRLGVGLAIAAVLLILMEIALRVVWKFTGAPSSDTVVVRNRFAPEMAAEVPNWLWNGMPPGLRSNVVGNAMAYPNPEYIFRVRPNPGGQPVYGFAGINALGFRTAHLDGERLPAEGVPKALRILYLGDSCAFGWGIRRFEQTMDPQIEQRLAAAGIGAEVINLAQPGFTTTQGRKLFDEWFPKLRPDFVILQYGWNDRRTSRGFTDHQVMLFLPIVNSRPAKLIMRTALYRTFAWAVHSPTLPPNPVSGDRDLDPVVDNDRMRVPLRESIANYQSMIHRSRAAGARVLIVIPPYLPTVRGLELRIRDFNREVEAAFEGEATYLALPAMREPTTDLASYFDPDGIHPSLKGARYIAEAIAEEIAREAHPQRPLSARQP
jgi:lysophospholipase L1-like esterase